jgi:hypothetical protein
MNSGDIGRAKNPDLRGSFEALRRAAVAARQTAIETNTAIIVVENGIQTRITAEELRKQRSAGTTKRR